ncbi:hypothetical protein [Nonomuraea sp. NPDC002799]
MSAAPKVAALRGGHVTLAAAADAFLATARTANPNTHRAYASAIDRTIDRLGRDRPLAEVTDAEIGTVLADLWGTSLRQTRPDPQLPSARRMARDGKVQITFDGRTVRAAVHRGRGTTVVTIEVAPMSAGARRIDDDPRIALDVQGFFLASAGGGQAPAEARAQRWIVLNSLDPTAYFTVAE